MRQVGILMVSSLSLLISGPARAAERGFDDLMRGDDYIVDHPHYPFGGHAADTEFIGLFGLPTWQLVADDFRLFVPATVRQIRWYGYYGGTFDEEIEPPPASEQMRIRFYEADVEDGLPATIAYEAITSNHTRSATGDSIQELIRHPEYLFEAQLVVSVHLQAQSYWLEIVQVGDLQSHFVWVYSRRDANGVEYINPNVTDWTQSVATSDAAFVLSNVPEPSTANLAMMIFGGMLHRLGRRWSMRIP